MQVDIADTRPQVGGGSGKGTTRCSNHALNKSVKVYSFDGSSVDNDDILTYLSNKKDEVESNLFQNLSSTHGFKWYISICPRFTRQSEGEIIEVTPCFRSCTQTLLQKFEFGSQFNKNFETIAKAVSNFQRQGSNWIFDKILTMELNIAKYVPLAGSSFIPLPKIVQNKKATINIKNNDQKCFLWSVLAQMHPKKHFHQRSGLYRMYENELNMSGIEYPVQLSKLDLFEKQNPSISVNVFGFEKEFFPLRIARLERETHINLLYMSDENTSHYCLITNLSRLFSKSTKHKGKAFYCNLCLHRFSKQSLLEEHIQLCSRHNPQKIEMPSKSKNNDIMKFNNFHFGFKVPFTIYADFESFNCKIPNSNIGDSNTIKTSKHEPSGYAYIIIDSKGCVFKPIAVYRGPNAVDHFLENILEEEEKLKSIMAQNKPLVVTAEIDEQFENATTCYICEKPLGVGGARDHCHMTSEFKGIACNRCNLQRKSSVSIPVFFHNLRGYDSHLIMQSLGKFKSAKITCIPNNLEKYISFDVNSLRFLDSLQFLSASLETLVNNLSGYGSQHFKIFNEYFQNSEISSLLLRKGVFPYDYMDSFERFDETRLPPKSAFFNSITDEHLSDSEYEHAVKVWDTFNIQNLGEYQDLYVKTDVLLLSDVFESFRNLCLENYKIDPCHTYTAPGLAWQACLRMTGVELELLTDPNMYIFLEGGIRGGVSVISTRHSLANNPGMSDFNSENPKSYITYWDMNNLYGVAMSQHLPISDFRWVQPNEFTSLDVEQIADDATHGYILEVDLEYPENLHDLHNEYPLAPEKMKISKSILSPYCKRLLKDFNMKASENIEKLVPNLNKKVRYVTHYRNLKQYLSLGLKVVKIHRILEFKQCPWLKQYIDFNTDQRKNARNNFEKDFFKLMNNAVFGKTMENLRLRINVELINTEKRLKKVVASPAFQCFKIFANELVGVHSIKKHIILNRPIYAGFTILELSKTFMYDFHYNYVKRKYPTNSKLLFTDTDSLAYEIFTDDVYKDMLDDIHLFDTSNFQSNHFLFSKTNMKVLGKMKDELDGRIVREFVGLRSKMYSFLEENLRCKKVAKGVLKATLQKQIKHTDYKESLFSKTIAKHQMVSIRSFNHEIFTINQRKTTLSCYDDKRFILPDGINTLAYGHRSISTENDYNDDDDVDYDDNDAV